MEKNKRFLAVAFGATLCVIAVVSVTGIMLMRRRPVVLQGQIEAEEISISGKLTGRIARLAVAEGDMVMSGDTLTEILCPEAEAKYNQVRAIESAAAFQSQKIDRGTRRQIVESARQLWESGKSQLALAEATYARVESLYRDSVVSLQRRDEAEAIYRSAKAECRAAYEQYRLAAEGAEEDDKASAREMVAAAAGGVGEVAAALHDTYLLSPVDGQVGAIFYRVGELVGAGTPLMSVIALSKSHAVLNVKENYLKYFPMGAVFEADVPALGLKKAAFRINFVSPLGSYATWRTTRQTGSYDMRTFEIHAVPVDKNHDLRPGMSVLVKLPETK